MGKSSSAVKIQILVICCCSNMEIINITVVSIQTKAKFSQEVILLMASPCIFWVIYFFEHISSYFLLTAFAHCLDILWVVLSVLIFFPYMYVFVNLCYRGCYSHSIRQYKKEGWSSWTTSVNLRLLQPLNKNYHTKAKCELLFFPLSLCTDSKSNIYYKMLCTLCWRVMNYDTVF